jgi:hypothetical protein
MILRKTLRMAALLLLMVSVASCCCNKSKSKGDDEPSEDSEESAGGDDKGTGSTDEKEELPPETSENTDPPAEKPQEASGKWVLNTANVRFETPPGWKKKFINGWNVFQPADRLATLGFTTYSRPNESTRRIGQINKVLGFRQMFWGGRRSYIIGRGRFRGQGGQGACQFKSGSTHCFAKYSTIETNQPVKLVMFYHLSLPTGQSKHGKEISKSWYSLDKIR